MSIQDKKIIKYIYFLIKRKRLIKKFNSHVHYFSYIENTNLEGSNKIGSMCKITNSEIGYGSYTGNKNILENVSIGRFCSIGHDIKIHCGQHPTQTFVSTNPAFYDPLNPSLSKTKLSFVDKKIFPNDRKYNSNGRSLTIKNDVWVGNEARFMEGVTINDGAIIGSGSLVTKDIPPFAIAAGVPAKIIKYRFNETERNFLISLAWWDREIDWIRRHSEYFSDLNHLIKKIEND
jgi:acetyltransferase-like isoleucine patch superfamily enzyme